MKSYSPDGPGGSWGRSWEHFGTRRSPRWVPGMPGAKKVMKRSSILRSFPSLGGTPKSYIVTFSNVCNVFWNTFPTAVFEGLRTAFLKDFGVIF